jgi:hypothetical protein
MFAFVLVSELSAEETACQGDDQACLCTKAINTYVEMLNNAAKDSKDKDDMVVDLANHVSDARVKAIMKGFDETRQEGVIQEIADSLMKITPHICEN